jgi:2-aminoadipate transaminase
MDANSTAVIDRFVFTGVRQAFGGPDRQLRDVESTPETGMDPAAFAHALATSPRPRAAVVIPDFHNPMGTSLGKVARAAVLEAGARHRVPIVEDDPYGLLSFGADPEVPLVGIAPESVLYIGSFSKIIAPALRLGWVVAPVDLVGRLRVIKESVDLECSALTQRTLAHYLAKGLLDEHLATLRAAYRVRRDAMLAALREHFPPGSRWSTPGGGMFIWCDLPDGFDTLALLGTAVAAGVAYVPGGAFAARPAPRTMRLNFSNANPDMIADGIARLGAVLRTAAPAAQAVVSAAGRANEP